MARKPGFTQEQHEIIGSVLAQMVQDLNALRILVDEAHGHTGNRASRIARSLSTAIDRIGRIRCELEDVYAETYPGVWETYAYFGDAVPCYEKAADLFTQHAEQAAERIERFSQRQSTIL